MFVLFELNYIIWYLRVLEFSLKVLNLVGMWKVVVFIFVGRFWDFLLVVFVIGFIDILFSIFEFNFC